MSRQGGGIQDISSLQLTCEHVLGITSTSNAAFVSHHRTGLLAYAAGCVIVVVDVKNGNQTMRIINLAKKEIVSVAFSNDGKYIASGEGGHKPSVRVWEIASGQLFAHFDGHDNSIPFVAFSPDDKYLVSIGNKFDNTINVWNWRKRERITSTKNTAEVHALAFPDGSNRFLTVGKGHAKFWYVEEENGGRFFLRGVVPAGSVAKKLFASAVYTDHSHAAAAYSKYLCKFTVETSSKDKENKKDKKEKWVLRSTEKTFEDVKHISALAVDAANGRLFVGCDNGTIKVVDAKTLEPSGSLPKPHRFDQMLGDNKNVAPVDSGDALSLYPDVVALSWLGADLAAVYSDHSIYIWNAADLAKVTKTQSWLFHSSRILGVDVYPAVAMPLLPAGSFATCGNDGTIRIWGGKNQKLLHVIYCGDLVEFQNNKQEPDSSAVANCVVFNPNGQELAAGFRNGNVRIYDLANIGDKITATLAGHNSSILALEYSRLNEPGVQLLAAGGNDGFISIFNVANGYSLQQSLKSLQSSAINGLRFAKSKNDASQIWLISSSQDKSLRLHAARLSAAAQMDSPDYVGKFDEGRQIVLPCSPHDVEINDQQSTVAVCCHDRLVRIYGITAGSNDPLCSYTAAGTNDGTLKKFSVDSNGTLVATVCSDKTISVAWRAWETKQVKDRSSHDRVLTTSSGHSEQMSGVKFFPDSPNFVTVAGDSCIFAWKAPSTENIDPKAITAMLNGRALEKSSPTAHKVTPPDSKSSRTPSNSSRSSKTSSSSPSSRRPPSTPTTPSKPVVTVSPTEEVFKEIQTPIQPPEHVEPLLPKSESEPVGLAPAAGRRSARAGGRLTHQQSLDERPHTVSYAEMLSHNLEAARAPIEHPLTPAEMQWLALTSGEEKWHAIIKHEIEAEMQKQEKAKLASSPPPVIAEEVTKQAATEVPFVEPAKDEKLAANQEKVELEPPVAAKVQEPPTTIVESSLPVESPEKKPGCTETVEQAKESVQPVEDLVIPNKEEQPKLLGEEKKSAAEPNNDSIKVTAEISLVKPTKKVESAAPKHGATKPPETTENTHSKPKATILEASPVTKQSDQETLKTTAEVSLKQPSRAMAFQKPTAKLDLIKASPSSSPVREPQKVSPPPLHLELQSQPAAIKKSEEDTMGAMASELQQLSARLVQQLHASPTISVRRRVLQAIFQVRRELDECLETTLFDNPDTKTSEK